jgi:hypothetical protein
VTVTVTVAVSPTVIVAALVTRERSTWP